MFITSLNVIANPGQKITGKSGFADNSGGKEGVIIKVANRMLVLIVKDFVKRPVHMEF